jgi:hypothetical protein
VGGGQKNGAEEKPETQFAGVGHGPRDWPIL